MKKIILLLPSTAPAPIPADMEGDEQNHVGTTSDSSNAATILRTNIEIGLSVLYSAV